MIQATRLEDVPLPRVVRDADQFGAYLEDASGAPPGRAAGLARPAGEAEAAAFLRRSSSRGDRLIFQAARTSLTAGAIPHDEIVVSVERMRRIGTVERGASSARVQVGPGVRLEELQEHLRPQGLFFPPVPTYQKAMVGGVVSTNAGGAATFKYGVTRQWVHGLHVLLENGDLLTLERGQALARPGEPFRIRLADGSRRVVPAPEHRLPDLKKISAGYHASDPLDLVDLFVGAEGTLGLITEVTLDLAPLPGALVTGLAFVKSVRAALALAGAMRDAALACRRSRDADGPDVRAIEFLDGNCLRLLREDPACRELRIPVPANAGSALLFEVELPAATTDEQARQALESMSDEVAGDGPLSRLFGILAEHGALDDLQFAFPGDRSRRRALSAFREAAPTRVNEVLAGRRARRPGVKKVGGDLIVPFESLGEMVGLYEEGFRRRGLDFVIWGHLSDGNLHPNALPETEEDVRRGFEALLEFADEATRRGGCPLSEHGVGRNPVKQEMLRRFLGRRALDRMREIKGILDPAWRLASGVLFSPR